MTVDVETWLQLVDQAQAAGMQILRRTEGGQPRVYVRRGPKHPLVEVSSLDELDRLIAGDACGPSCVPPCTNQYSGTPAA